MPVKRKHLTLHEVGQILRAAEEGSILSGITA
jgi:hypothetical protein